MQPLFFLAAGSSGGAPPEWFRIAFGDLYPLLYPHRDDASAEREAAQLVDLLGLRGRRARAIDLGCGTGRHAAALARLGLCVVGLDLSDALLARARQRGTLCGALVRADLRRLPFRPAFDLALSLFTSFGYFDDAENERTLQAIAYVLAPGGQLVIDHIHPPALAAGLVPEDTRFEAGCRIHQRREIVGSRVRKRITVRRDTGETIELCEDVRLYAPEELARLLQRTGLTDVRFFGSFAGDPLTEETQRMIVVARRM